MENKIILFVILALGLLLVSGCYNTNSGGTTQAVPAPGFEYVEEMVVVEEPEEKAEEVVKEIRVTAKRFEFIPDPITVNKGDRVKLLITSIDTAHGFNINAPFLSINKMLPVGEEVVIEFTATETGSWTFSCSVPCGSGHGGMSGQLIVK